VLIYFRNKINSPNATIQGAYRQPNLTEPTITASTTPTVIPVMIKG